MEDGWPWYLTVQLTTPISYLTSTNLLDPFRESYTRTYHPYWRRYRYINYPANRDNWGGLGPNWIGWRPVVAESDILAGMDKYGLWKLSSAGPDRFISYDSDHGFFSNEPVYDPTNGTVSRGDIIRSQKESNVTDERRTTP